jgi:DNA-binding CsgD family transcriptional regulator
MLRLGQAFMRKGIGRAALPGVTAGLLAAGVLGLLLEVRLTDLLLTQAAERAVDQAELGVVQQVAAADLAPPFDTAKLARVDAALGPLLRRVRQPGSGIVRVNVFGRDGTVLDSDEASLRGQKIHTDDMPLLSAALHGATAVEQSPLQGPENVDLRNRFSDALEVYVPLEQDGQVIGAYELYLDHSGARPLRPLGWILVVAGLLSLGCLVVARRAGPPPPPPAVRRREPSPVRSSVSLAEVTLSPPGRRPLSPRELEVLSLLAGSHTYRDIASALTISEETVRTHVKSILRKLDQPDRTQAVVAAVRSGLLRLP